MTKATDKDQYNFDRSIKKLEEIVEKMEDSNLPLEQSIKLFEQGMELSKSCQIALKTAEGKIQKLMEDNKSLENFEESDEKGTN